MVIQGVVKMTKTNLKAAAVIATALAATGCASVNTAFDQATGLGNQALSSFNNQTFDTATSIKYDNYTGKPSFVAESEGVGACLRSDELRTEVQQKIKTQQNLASLTVAHEKFKSETETCAQYKAYKLGENFGCAAVQGDVIVKTTGTEPATPKECSTENTFLRLTEIKKGAYLPGGKYNP